VDKNHLDHVVSDTSYAKQLDIVRVDNLKFHQIALYLPNRVTSDVENQCADHVNPKFVKFINLNFTIVVQETIENTINY